MVGVEVPAGEFEGVKRSLRQEMKKKKKNELQLPNNPTKK